MYCIYEIKNLINNKTYIGQHKTNNLNDDYMGSGKILHQAYEKYGKNNFRKSILAVTETKENINILEKVFIKLYREEGKAEYNITDGGTGGNVYKYLSDEQMMECKHKISLKSKGHKLSKESRDKISKARIGMKFSEETRKKIGEASKGRKHTQEWKDDISRKLKGKKKKPMSDEGRRNISLAHIGLSPGNKGVTGIYHWYTNGKDNILSKECPNGFYKGRVKNGN